MDSFFPGRTAGCGQQLACVRCLGQSLRQGPAKSQAVQAALTASKPSGIVRARRHASPRLIRFCGEDRACPVRRRFPGGALPRGRPRAARRARDPAARRGHLVRLGRLDHRRPLLHPRQEPARAQARLRDHRRGLRRARRDDPPRVPGGGPEEPPRAGLPEHRQERLDGQGDVLAERPAGRPLRQVLLQARLGQGAAEAPLRARRHADRDERAEDPPARRAGGVPARRGQRAAQAREGAGAPRQRDDAQHRPQLAVRSRPDGRAAPERRDRARGLGQRRQEPAARTGLLRGGHVVGQAAPRDRERTA